jgi:hypothetical protein
LQALGGTGVALDDGEVGLWRGRKKGSRLDGDVESRPSGSGWSRSRLPVGAPE